MHIYTVPLKDTSPGLRVCTYMCYSVLKLCNRFVGMSLSEPHSNLENGTVAHA